MEKKKLILVISKDMDSNKKESRDEDNLIRISKIGRTYMGFLNKQVELCPTVSTKKDTSQTITLNIFHAFSSDIKKLKDSNNYSQEELKRIGFVTTNTFNRMMNKDNNSNDFWISNTVEKTMIGADPEFLIFDDDNQVVRAINIPGFNKDSQLGCDGAMAEIRPKPSTCINQFIENIRMIFANDDLTKEIKDYKWIAGCYHKDNNRDYPMGGHIHIGNPKQISVLNFNDKMGFFCVINKILDELLAIPLTRIDGDQEGSSRRSKCMMAAINSGYGWFGEWRPCDGRLEYRTLSGMWLMNPSLSKAVLGTAKAIVGEIFKLAENKNFENNFLSPKNFARLKKSVWNSGYDEWKDIPLIKIFDCTKSSQKMINILNTSKASNINAAYLNKWYGTLKGMSTYNENSTYIDGLYEILKIPIKEINKFDLDIKKNWLEDQKFIITI